MFCLVTRLVIKKVVICKFYIMTKRNITKPLEVYTVNPAIVPRLCSPREFRNSRALYTKRRTLFTFYLFTFDHGRRASLRDSAIFGAR